MAELSRRLKSVGAPAPIATAAVAQPQLQPQVIQTQQQQPAAQHAQPQQRRVPDYALEGLEQELAIQPVQQRVQQRPAEQTAANRAAAQPRPAGDPGVRIGPFRPDPSLIQARPSDHEIEQARAHEAARSHAATAPRVEDFPPVAQRQLRAQAAPGHAEEGQKPRGLLARLASGLARHAEAAVHESPRQRERDEPRVAQAQPAPHPAVTPAAEFAKPQPRRMGEPAAATGTLDPRGRPMPIDPRHDDHLEIPAFLRRQSS
jgi:cell division protein FtsZ